jgi:hypothetical protein
MMRGYKSSCVKYGLSTGASGIDHERDRYTSTNHQLQPPTPRPASPQPTTSLPHARVPSEDVWTKDNFCQLMVKLHYVVCPRPVDLATAKANAESDWAREAGAKEAPLLDYTLFTKSIFQLVDIWTETLEESEYIGMLQRILDRLTKVRPGYGTPGFEENMSKRTWVDDDDPGLVYDPAFSTEEAFDNDIDNDEAGMEAEGGADHVDSHKPDEDEYFVGREGKLKKR